MKRKIIRMADSTSLISLPKQWIDLNKINKGDEIELKEFGNNLIIKGKYNQSTNVINMNNIDDYDLVWRYIVTSYRKGIDNIQISYNNENTLKEIQKFIADLIGYAIVSQDSNNIIIKDLIQADNHNLDETLKKVLSLLIDMSNTLYNALNKADKDSLKSIEHADYNVNRFTNLFLRILNREGHVNFEKTNSYYKIINFIEEIGDEYRRLASTYNGKKIAPESMVIFKSVNYLLQDFEDLMYKYDENKLKNFHDVANRIHKLLINSNPKDQNETRIIGSLSTIFHLTKSLSEESMMINI